MLHDGQFEIRRAPPDMMSYRRPEEKSEVSEAATGPIFLLSTLLLIVSPAAAAGNAVSPPSTLHRNLMAAGELLMVMMVGHWGTLGHWPGKM